MGAGASGGEKKAADVLDSREVALLKNDIQHMKSV